MTELPKFVVFTTDDCWGLWRKNELAEDLGWETARLDAPPVRLLRLRGEVIALYDPFTRGLVAEPRL